MTALRKGWRVFFAIPIPSLKLDLQFMPVKCHANVFRNRKLGEPEFTSWAPLEKETVLDTSNYGTWIFDFNW